MRLIELMPNPVRQMIQGLLPPGEDELITVSADLSTDGRYSTHWIVVTGKRIVIISQDNTGDVMKFPVEEVASVRTEPLVGGGRLEIERKGNPTAFVYYSNSMAVKYSEVARGIEQLRKGETVPNQ